MSGLQQVRAGEMETLLLECLRVPPAESAVQRLPELQEHGWQELSELAQRQGVASLLYSRLQAAGPVGQRSAASIQSLRSSHLLAALRATAIAAQLKEISEALRGRSIEAIVLKGAFLAEAVYPSRALREMLDIDLLFDERELPAAVEVLRGLGYEATKPFRVDAVLGVHRHLPPFFRKGAVASIEPHGSIGEPGRGLCADFTELRKRAIPFEAVGGSPVFALCPEDLLLHLSRHISYGHQFDFGLKPYCDVAELLRVFGEALDWSQVVERAMRCRIARGTYLTLRLAREWMAAAVPDSALAALEPPEAAESILPEIREQVFSDGTRSARRGLSTAVARMLETPGLRARLKLLFDGIFLDRKVALAYQEAQPGPAGIFSYYFQRVFGLLWRYGPLLAGSLRGDASLALRAKRTAAIDNWLALD